jgi:hypothetical protein
MIHGLVATGAFASVHGNRLLYILLYCDSVLEQRDTFGRQ